MKNKRTNLFVGLILIFLGILTLLGSLNIIKFNIFFNGWWTLFIIIPSIINMLEEKIKLSNVLLLLLGIALLLSSNNIIKFSFIFKFMIPLFLIIIGISIILSLTYNDSKMFIFSNKTLNLDEDKSNINSLFASTTLKLNELIKKDLFLKINGCFSDVVIYVPKNTNIQIDSSNIFSDIIDYREEKNKNYKYTLYLKANSIFSDIVIKEVNDEKN